MSSPGHQSDEELFAARGFGHRIGYGQRPSLLVIDFINGFTDPSYPLGADLDSQIGSALDVLDSARASEVPILYTTVKYDDVGEGFAGVWQLKQYGLSSLLAGSPAIEIDTRLGRLPSEPVVAKKYASAFFGTDLSSWLISRSIDTVVLVGCTTSGCIRATAVDAIQYGLRPIIVEEAVGDRSVSAHHQALFDLDQKYADVVLRDDVVRYFRNLPSRGSA